MQKMTEQQLKALGFENTLATVDEHQIWQSSTEKIIYDSQGEEVLERYPREFKENIDPGPFSHLGVGLRQYNDKKNK